MIFRTNSWYDALQKAYSLRLNLSAVSLKTERIRLAIGCMQTTMFALSALSFRYFAVFVRFLNL